MTTDLIARLTDHIAMHEKGVREQDDAKLCLCDLAEDLPAFLHALKVQEAAEAACQEMTWAEFIGKKWPALVRVVKGAQP